MKEMEQRQYPMPVGGLSALDEVQLSPELERVHQEAVATCGGPPEWQHRKIFEARELLALGMIAPRFNVVQLDLRESLRAMTFMRVPVPLRPGQNGELRTAPYAMLGFIYRENAVVEPLPGYEFVQILHPEDLWHPNIADQAGGQALCLGLSLPAGIRMKELVLLAYGAISMQQVMVDERSREGVLNLDAAKWWQVPANLARAPLTREAFLAKGDGYLVKKHEEKVKDHD